MSPASHLVSNVDKIWLPDYDDAAMLRVLIADDSPSLRLGLRAALEAAGFAEVIEASEGDQALALAITRRPDVAILDVSLGAANGFDVCRAIRADARLVSVAVVMLTGHTEPAGEAERLGRAAGADRVLFKPISPRELRAAVDEVAARPD